MRADNSDRYSTNRGALAQADPIASAIALTSFLELGVAKTMAGGYCSKPCVANRDCYSGSTGLVCDQVILDPVFIAEMEQKDPLTAQRYLGDIRFTSYCVVPRQ